MLHHFHSVLWMTYRTSFTPIAVGDVQLRSDAGWGCTLRRCAVDGGGAAVGPPVGLPFRADAQPCCRRRPHPPRSGQMVLAQGLQRHLLGRDWRWPHQQHEAPAEAPPEQLRRLLQLFWDTPAGGCAGGGWGACLLHLLPCAAACLLLPLPPRVTSPAPLACCRAQRLFAAQPLPARPALRGGAGALAGPLGHVPHARDGGRGGAGEAGSGERRGSARHQAHAPSCLPHSTHPTLLQAHHDLGVTVAVLADAGGGAPLLVASHFEGTFQSGGGSSESVGQRQQDGTAAAAAAAAAPAEADPAYLVPVDNGTLAVEASSPAAALVASTCQLSLGSGGRGLILLVPLVLGLGKVWPALPVVGLLFTMHGLHQLASPPKRALVHSSAPPFPPPPPLAPPPPACARSSTPATRRSWRLC